MSMQHDYVKEHVASWSVSAPDFPFAAPAIALSDKRRRETMLDQYIDATKALGEREPHRRSLTKEEEASFIADTRAFLRDGLDFNDHQLEVMFSEALLGVTREFVRQTRRFDSGLDFNDVFQACRNMWVMAVLQTVLGMPVRLTPSIFAYSLLYPYTDNLIDDPRISSADKALFSSNFRRRLAGELPQPGSHAERKIFTLVEMIEGEFQRTDYPGVYDSLLAIHEAQTRSAQLIHSGDSLSDAEIFEISIAKGGASVLADGCLVAGSLTHDQERFLFGYGAYLQLLDDIQDAREDRAAGLHTIFSRGDEVLEAKVNRTYWFGEGVIRGLPLFGRHHLDVFASLMQKSKDLLIIGAVAQHPELYSPEYISAMEEHSPFRCSYIRRHGEQFVPYNSMLLSAVEALTFDDDAPEEARHRHTEHAPVSKISS